MNLLLLEPGELDAENRVWLSGARAEHLRSVLGASVGKELRAGVLDHSLGLARVLSVTQLGYLIEYSAAQAATLGRDRCLLLAIPRPKVLSRCLEHAAALGFTRIILMRTARVEKSHLKSHKLLASDIEPHLRAGLEQGMRVVLPDVQVFDRFKPFVEDRLSEFVTSSLRFVGHPHAETALAELAPIHGEYCLALGPEGGFVPFEISLLAAQGFLPVRAAMGPLRVESALSYVTGQLDLLRQRG